MSVIRMNQKQAYTMDKKTIISFSISFLFLILGFLLLHLELIGYGVSFFVFLPFIIGFLMGGTKVKKESVIGAFMSLTLFFILLLSGNLEGMVCVLMSLPIVIAAVFMGFAVKYSVSNWIKKSKNRQSLKSTIFPFILFITSAFVETELTKDQKFIDEVRSEIILPYPVMDVYEAIKSVNTLDAEKPFLMNLDLPIPQKCILEEEKVGGIRTCYFEGGLIVEKITSLEKGKLLQMDVIDYQLTGRKWLGFREAIYHFEELENGKTKMTRITTYDSELYPRFYWSPLEKIGIEQEHEYVFRNLLKDLKAN